MFSKVALFVATLAAFAAAAPTGDHYPTDGNVSQCNTGPIQCCNTVQSAKDFNASDLAGLLGIVVQDVTAMVGVTCTPVDVIGLGGNSCTQQPVCCQNNNFNGLVAIGCTPINVNA